MVTPAMAEKAHNLLDQHRVLIVLGDPGRALVIGDSGVYEVVATATGVRCNCPAGQMLRQCSHRFAALVAWAEVGDGEP